MELKTIELTGRIDSGNAAKVEEDIRSGLDGWTGAVELNSAALEYISSAGLRVILRLRKAWPELRITNVSPEVYDVLEMTGFTEMMPVEKAYLSVSVEGCEVIGEGQNGKVYRIDRDTVVKTYKNADALTEIRHEREVARLALILGVPTAISYDIVRVGDSYGSVFELLNCRSFAGILAEEPERLDWCVGEYSRLLRTVHGTHVPAGKLPSIKATALEWTGRIAPVLPGEYGAKLARLVAEVPERDTMIHGDFHAKNIVLAENEVLLIDMDTLSVGHPIFELAQMYVSYIGFSEQDPTAVERFMGFSFATAKAFWKRSLAAYLGVEDGAALTAAEDRIRLVAYVRMIDWSRRHNDPGTEADRAARALWTSELLALLDRVDSLDFAVPGA